MPRFAFCIIFLTASLWAQAPKTLEHFAKIDEQVFVGSKPHSDEDFAYLQAQHVKYIVNAHFLPFLSGPEKRKAKKYGMEFIAIPMNASFIPPCRKHVNRILLTLHDTAFEPVYVHCVLGRDRTSLISGLYKIYFEGVSKDEAWTEMRKANFKTWFFLRGLKAYFDKNADHPPSAAEKAAYEQYNRQHEGHR